MMMFGEMFPLKVTITLGNQIIQQQEVQIPELFAQQNIIQTIQQIAQDKRPMWVKFETPYYTDDNKVLMNEINFYNNTYFNEFGEEGCK